MTREEMIERHGHFGWIWRTLLLYTGVTVGSGVVFVAVYLMADLAGLMK